MGELGMEAKGRKWEHSLGHDLLTAEHNALVDAADALAKTLHEIERAVLLPRRERDLARVALANYCGASLPEAPDAGPASLKVA